eukprot:762975-Hanusia_phi.AAC.5
MLYLPSTSSPAADQLAHSLKDLLLLFQVRPVEVLCKPVCPPAEAAKLLEPGAGWGQPVPLSLPTARTHSLCPSSSFHAR